MKFTEYLFKEVEGIWRRYLEHPFIKELGEGTLDKDKFKDYLIQDYLYLKEYSKVFCVGVIKATTMAEMKFFYKSIEGTMEDETATHIKYLKDFGISDIEAEKYPYEMVTTSYTSYMQGLALTGDIKDVAITVMPCTWSYNYIGKYLAETYKSNLEDNFYKPWIEVYASKEFDEFTKDWIDFINKLCEDITEDEKKRLTKIFIKSSLYELDFWDMAYKLK